MEVETEDPPPDEIPSKKTSSLDCLTPSCRCRMKTAGLLLFLSVTLSSAQKHRPEDHKNEEKVNSRGCSNLTLVLDNWKYAIMTQVKDLLLHDHSTVLPDYGRIQPLSDALGDLYKEFNALKERLSELTDRFDGVEGFVDGVRSGRKPTPPRGEPRPPGEAEPAGRPQGRRTRVVVRRIKKPEGPQD
ncbi:hypothetical protein VZT92_012318 [Zoarces viviparus]|uniref:Uncharacterized protein n=1 Tax=Zoarces viviparus TaxID=48416 RepID=A0AAW1F8A4_ZOAVI